jgi:hypothetical protein
LTIRRPSPVERCGPQDLPYSGRIYRTGGRVQLVEVNPLPPATLSRSEPSRAEPKKKPKDWLATEEEESWQL